MEKQEEKLGNMTYSPRGITIDGNFPFTGKNPTTGDAHDGTYVQPLVAVKLDVLKVRETGESGLFVTPDFRHSGQ